MLIALLDDPQSATWSDAGHRLHLLKDACHQAGHRTIDLSPERSSAGTQVVIAACGRETDTNPIIDASRLVEQVARAAPDMCIAPLRGGLAHGILMARACGELPAALRVFLLLEESSRSAALRSDLTGGSIGPLICDAMERFCLERSDGLLAGPEDLPEQLVPPDAALPPILRCRDVQHQESALLIGGSHPSELCFIGPFARFANVVAFVEAAEHLCAGGAFDRVVFIGPISDLRYAPGKEWLGKRALRWNFAWRTIETTRFSEALDYVAKSGAMAYAPKVPPARRSRIDSVGPKAMWLDAEAGRHASSIMRAITAALDEQTAGLTEGAKPSMTLGDAIHSSKARQTSARAPTSLCLCILHKDRPAYLKQAVESVLADANRDPAHQVDIIIFDNGSVKEESIATIEGLSVLPRIRLVRQSPPLPHSSAMNAMAAECTSDFMVFLDDDNLIAPGGIERLIRACSTNIFEVITSNLFIIEADRPDNIPTAKLVFIGPAATSGLFFNFFGDTCMAFKREAFQQIGGFFDAKAPSPAPDWVLLARAQAAGLKIGVLQNPAFLYRRDVGRADLNWQKYDQHGLRDLVLSNYGDRFDAALLAKLAQSLMVDRHR